jgi:hypothetical protein
VTCAARTGGAGGEAEAAVALKPLQQRQGAVVDEAGEAVRVGDDDGDCSGLVSRVHEPPQAHVLFSYAVLPPTPDLYGLHPRN